MSENTKNTPTKNLSEDITIGQAMSRDLMPQITDTKSFLQKLRSKGVNHKVETLDTADLKTSQSEFDRDKIKSMVGQKNEPSIVSRDGHILDGHHRAMADDLSKGKTKVIKVDMNILDLISTAKRSSLDEEVTHKEFGPMLDSFVSFASDYLGIDSLPKIRYKESGESFASFGGYNPGTQEIVIQTKGRHPMDVLRTLAHELVHHKQKENGEITLKNAEESGKTGSKIERHANAEAGDMMRHFRKGNEKLFDSGPLVEAFLAEAAVRPKDDVRFKTVILGGGAGSGKDYVLKKVLSGHGLKEVNSDHAFKYLLKKEGLPETVPQSPRRDKIRNKALSLTQVRQNALLAGKRGIVINTTASEPEKITQLKTELERQGHDVKMLFVHTSNEVSRARNEARGKAGGRAVPEEIRSVNWKNAQKAKKHYKKLFGDHYHEVDNSLDMNTASDEQKGAKEAEFTSLYKKIGGWAASKPDNPVGRAQLETELSKRRNRSKKTVKKPATTAAKPKRTIFNVVSPEVNAAAKSLGLAHRGNNYWGPRKKGPGNTPIITHRVNEKGALVKVSPKKTPLIPQPIKEDLRDWFNPKHPEGGWKRINSKGEAIGPCAREKGEPKPKCMSNEKRAKLTKKERAAAVKAKRKHDPNPERKGNPINVSNFGKGRLEEENKPTNPELWARAKSLAKKKFDVYPSAYANGWASKWYKSKGGGWKSVNETFDDYMSNSANRLLGSDSLVKIYKKMTPDQYANDTMIKNTIETHPLVPEETQKKKKKGWKRKKLTQEAGVTASASDSVLVSPTGVGPPSGGGIGPEFGIGRSGMLGIAGTPYGTGMPANFSSFGTYGLVESVETWAKNPKTIAAYRTRYGARADQKLKEDKDKMSGKTLTQLREAWGDRYGAMGTVPATNTNKDEGIAEDSPAWQRKEGKRESGGLNQKGVKSYRRENPGSKLQTAVTTKPSKLKKGSKAAKRRLSFCRRMKGMKAKLTSAKTARDPDSRINKSLRAWNCEE